MKYNDFCDITGIKYNKKSSKTIFKILSKKILNSQQIETLKNELADISGTDYIDLELTYDVDSKDLKIVELYISSLIDRLGALCPSTKARGELLSFNYKDNICTLTIENTAMLNLLESKNIPELFTKKTQEEINKKITYILTPGVCEVNFDYLDDLSKIASEEIPIAKTVKDKPKEIKQVEIRGESEDISQITSPTQSSIVSGSVFAPEIRTTKNGKQILNFIVGDEKGAISVMKFVNDNEYIPNAGDFVKISGAVELDNFSHDLLLRAKKIQKIPKVIKKDTAKDKMVELHAHTYMSQSDGIESVGALFDRVKAYEQDAIAILDHEVVQAFPEVMEKSKAMGIKPIYGCEFNMVDDAEQHIRTSKIAEFYDTYVVFDIETTGFSNINDKITEIGAVKISDGKIIDTYSQLINPGIPIPEKIVELTGISDVLVADKPSIEEVLPTFLEFCKGSILVAHNSEFDTGFIRQNSKNQNLDYNFDAIDTLVLSRLLLTNLKNHKLDTITKELDVVLETHHRAIDDATATAHIFLKFIEILKQREMINFNDINDKIKLTNISKIRPTHVSVLAKNQAGIKDLYILVTMAHTTYLQGATPVIPKSELKNLRQNILIGAGYLDTDVFNFALNAKTDEEIQTLMSFYDYIELNPTDSMTSLINEGRVSGKSELENINSKLYFNAKEINKPVIASNNVHYLDEKDIIYRKILKASIKRKDESPDNVYYYRTTTQMLEEFSYLGEEVAKEIVITNTNAIKDIIEDAQPVPDGTFPPVIDGAEDELRNSCYEKAKNIYGEDLPELIKTRLDKELNSIIENGYSVLYIIAKKLVAKSNSDGYLVGSRGSVGSSLAAYMSDITEVNSLPPHYICDHCKHSEFILDGSFGAGVDMPDKACPKCGQTMRKDGYDIPFETFLGFNGDKEPDIDLNFAGEYQPNAHQFIMDLFGKDYVYRAGTISTIASKTAFGYVKKYEEVSGLKFSNKQEIILQEGITGIKRTSGQHPGGIMVCPKYKDIYDFTPISYPANMKKSETLTTHFDYHSISGRILKLDILGHDGPSMIKQLEFLTGTTATNLPLKDEKTLAIFLGTDVLQADLSAINCNTGTLGIPEFGTVFVRQMLEDTKPKAMSELIRIAGLSHGTDVWLGNAQELIKNSGLSLNEVICTRDDIMLYLIQKGVEKKTSFDIMEKVRKGKGLSEDHEKAMRENSVPDWYIDSCKKIQYMFPKAHAVAYVMLSIRIAYYKVHYKEAFYATHFTTKAEDFDINIISKGEDAVLTKLNQINMLGNDATTKEKGMAQVLEVAYEMYKRKVKIGKVDLYKSDASQFLLDEDKSLIPPFLAIPGLGRVVADKIFAEARLRPFVSLQDLKQRTGASKTVVEQLQESGCLDGLSETNQLSFNF
ncbi:MAG: PolC-type DNA polymerase III [Peptostreptococcaceae bacterium]|nr:PolC-type DNA polymerase III [Peptostreptococcaceae bacterium]